MKFLCDVHISYKLTKFLSNAGHEAIHINYILEGSFTEDQAIARYADSNGFVVITKDSDFRDSHFVNKTPKRVIRICLGNISNIALTSLLEQNLPKLITALEQESVYIEIHDPLIRIFER